MTTALDPTTRHAATDAPLAHPLRARWSPRAFDADVQLTEQHVTTLLEAARWAPSASNTQPWRFAVAHRGTKAFDAVHATLIGFNQAWADSASVLVVAAVERVDVDGNPRTWAQYDLGQAVAHLTIQAQHDGLHTHQIGGFDRGALRQVLSLPDEVEPVTVVAVGVPLAPADVPEHLREREFAPRSRRPLADLIVQV